MGSLALIIAMPQGRTSSVMTATAEGCVATRSVYSTAYRQDASHDDVRGGFLARMYFFLRSMSFPSF
jgi:hypothetical protein